MSKTFRDTAPSITKTQLIDAGSADGRRKMFLAGATEIMLSVRKPAVASNLTGQFILAFHATELALKAFLSKHGVSKKSLRKHYNHDLAK